MRFRYSMEMRGTETILRVGTGAKARSILRADLALKRLWASNAPPAKSGGDLVQRRLLLVVHEHRCNSPCPSRSIRLPYKSYMTTLHSPLMLASNSPKRTEHGLYVHLLIRHAGGGLFG